MILSYNASKLFEKLVFEFTKQIVELAARKADGVHAMKLSDFLEPIMSEPDVTTEERVIVGMKIAMAIPDITRDVMKKFGGLGIVVSDSNIPTDDDD